MREVRWRLQAAKPGSELWVDQDDRVYSGWFHSTGDDEPSPTIIEAFNKAAEEFTWLDVRLIQETKSFTQVALMVRMRSDDEDVSKNQEG